MFKKVSLSEETWQKIVGKLTGAGADDETRCLAGAIEEQTSGAVVVRASSKSVQFKARKGGDLRGMLGL